MNLNFKNTKLLLILSILLTVILYFYPINSFILRISLILSIISNVILLFLNFGKSRIFIYISIVFVIFTILLFVSGGNYNKSVLDILYIKNLKKYENTKYVRGGENKIGIDCSGLLRKAMIDSYREYGFKTLNGKLLKKAFSLWWYDSSAKALLSNYRNQTKILFKSESINLIDYTKIKSGNFAITADGIHVLVYLGNKKWIEADPNFQKVIIESIPTDNYWFNVPVVVLEWSLD